MGTRTQAGLTEDEAFLVTVKRRGSLDAISREFAREHSEQLWKQLVIAPEDDAAPASATRTGTPKAGSQASAVSKVGCRTCARSARPGRWRSPTETPLVTQIKRTSARGPARGTVIDTPDAP